VSKVVPEPVEGGRLDKLDELALNERALDERALDERALDERA
jgi:hypothetical protein